MSDKTRAEQIFAAFKVFHAKNPTIWELFDSFAVEASARFSHYSSNAIFERIRWHVNIKTGEEVKLSNNFRPYYARMFHLARPDLNGFFRNRKLRSLDARASAVDMQVFIDEGPVAEEWLEAGLRDLIGVGPV